jgi:cell division protease FtsH
MQKIWIYFKIHWLKVLLSCLFLAVLTGIFIYIKFAVTSFNSLETFSQRQLGGMMALYLPMMIIAQVVMLPFIFFIYWYLMKGGAIGKLDKHLAGKDGDKVLWDDIIGMKEAKTDAQELVRLLKDHALQKTLGGNIIKGALLMGPPGCGKTYLAKAMATECGLPMLTAAGSDFIAMFVGQGAARMKSLFKQARNEAKIHGGCVIFIDEIDAFARPRTGDQGFGGETSRSAAINQFLTEFDGLRKKENNIMILAATNVEEDELDEAIMRSGRFDRKIRVEKPNQKEREGLLKYYFSKVSHEPGINIEEFADKCQWFSPSDIANVVKEAGVIANRNKHATILKDDLLRALDRVIRSVEKMGVDKILTQKINVKWSDLIGMEETKKDAWEIVELLRDRHKLKVVGGNIIKGLIMIGPPGCGKTYLAKAIATESGFPFITTTGGELNSDRWVGTGARKIKDIFEEARKVARSEGGCIIFIDEIDALIRPREQKGIEQGASREENRTINQFLTEMDGLKNANEEEGNVVVLAATNIDEGKLDEAVLRSGRFDRKLYFNKPSQKDREKLFEFYLKTIQHETFDLQKLAEKAKWFSAADVKNAVREAAILAMREKRETANQTDIETAIKRVIFSLEQTGENKILGEKTQVSWDQVIGMEDTKEETWEIVKMLKDRKMVEAIGGKIVKGVVLFGPPGCGKTYLVKAIATESGFPMISAVGSELVGMFVGEGGRKMRDIFKEARAIARAEGGCIIFFDEIDSFARPRTPEQGFGGATSHNATINQFLTELDGLRQTENNIFVVGATNVPESALDPAIMRSGRLERKIHVRRPNLSEREDLFTFYLSKVKAAPEISAKQLARMAPGFTPAQIDNMIREASLIALRSGKDAITPADMTESYDRLTLGALSKKKYSGKDVRKTACHEAGHALLTYIFHKTDEVIKATIRPRGDALGYIYYVRGDDFETGAQRKEDMLISLIIGLGGYAAEKMIFNTTASGVYGDFTAAMKIARHMVWNVGMGKSGFIGNLDEYPILSERTKEKLDDDVQDILRGCLKTATETLDKHREVMEFFSRELIRKGDLQHDEIIAIFKKFNIKSAREREAETDSSEGETAES